MDDNKKIGFVGAGNMAGALIRGLIHSGTVAPAQIQASDVRDERLAELAEQYGISTTRTTPSSHSGPTSSCSRSSRRSSTRCSPPIGAALPPSGARRLDRRRRPHRGARSAACRKGARVIRTMPNTAAIALAGATAIAAGHARDRKTTSRSRARLFEAVGRVVVLDETLLDAVTGLSGSGPAYVMLIIEALADGGVKVGLHRDTALLLAAQTVYGSAKLLLETGEHPGRLKDMVTSPGGTAIAGLHTLEAGGLRTTLINAVENATRALARARRENGRKTSADPRT